MMMGFGHGYALLMPFLFLGRIFMLVLLGLLIWGLIRLFSTRGRQYHMPPRYNPVPPTFTPGIPPSQPSAMEILRQRYARGQIDAATFENMRERIENTGVLGLSSIQNMFVSTCFMTIRLAVSDGESLDALKNDGMPERIRTIDKKRGNEKSNYEYHSFRRYIRIWQPFTNSKTTPHSTSVGGWRLGYAALPPTSAGTMAMVALRSLASEIWSSTTTPVQEAALVAYSPNESIEQYVHQSALVHGYLADRLYTSLVEMDVPCPRPAGGFYLYPDFSPWRSALASLGIKTGSELVHYLLEEWDIATLPGSAFGEPKESLRLRLSTSLLCLPVHENSTLERETVLWEMLSKAETLYLERDVTLSTPALERAQARLTEVIQHFNRINR